MIFKIPYGFEKKIEEIYSETGSQYNKRKLVFPMGSVLTELLNIDYLKINKWINKHFQEFDRLRIDFNRCEYFRSLSDEAKFLLIFCTKLRFLSSRVGMTHAAKKDHYFSDVERTIYFIRKAVEEGKDNESYFSFFLKYHLGIHQDEGLYGSNKDLNILNYFFPIVLDYVKKHELLTSIEPLYELLLKAEEDRTKITDLIELVPKNTVHREMIETIHDHFWCAETGRYRFLQSKSLDAVADLFSHDENRRLQFIEIIYDYECGQSDKLYAFNWLSEYIGMCTLECYKNHFPICRCLECGKYFVRTSNSRRLCGDPECTSRNKKRAAQQRKVEFHIDDGNLLSAVYKALCYSKAKKAKASLDKAAYAKEDGISLELSSQIVTNLQIGLIQDYRDDNKKYKKDIRRDEIDRDNKIVMYNDWLQKIKALYSHQYVIECYRNSELADPNSNKPFALDYYLIDNWEKIVVKKYPIIQ